MLAVSLYDKIIQTMACFRCRAKSKYIPVCCECVPTQFSVHIRQSPIHGLGLFATRTIAEGELIAPYMGDIVDLDTAVRTYPQGGDYLLKCGDLPVYINALCHSGQIGLGGLVNHDPHPNSKLLFVELQDQLDQAHITPIWVCADAQIRKGDEITVNYGTQYHWPTPT